MPMRAGFKDFLIAVGQPGAYSSNMVYEPAFGVAAEYQCHVKHAPYSIMNKIKNVVVQSWKDEDGDDVWLPQVTGSKQGAYDPDIKHEAVEYKVTFEYMEMDHDANTNIRMLQERIEGRWLKIYDGYTGIGFEGVYLMDIDDDPKFKRRNYDRVQFVLTFKVNGRPLSDPLEVGV